MKYLPYILTVPALLWAVYGVYLDYESSRRSKWYGGRETNGWLMGEFGYINMPRFLAVWITAVSACLFIPLIFSFSYDPNSNAEMNFNPMYGAAVLLAVLGTAEFARGWNNMRRQNTNRTERQIPALQNVGRYHPDNLRTFTEYPAKNGVITAFYREFAFVRAEVSAEFELDARAGEVRAILYTKLKELSEKPEDQWFIERVI